MASVLLFYNYSLLVQVSVKGGWVCFRLSSSSLKLDIVSPVILDLFLSSFSVYKFKLVALLHVLVMWLVITYRR